MAIIVSDINAIRKGAVVEYLGKLAAGIPKLQVTNLQKEFIKAAIRALAKGVDLTPIEGPSLWMQVDPGAEFMDPPKAEER